ncbi:MULTISPECIES: DUF1648 domain-containing protein [unclassified Mammaliicoccus]|uniref:DUF1648 domain-containing protein n=1 Tax=unclassified Mammaliicoccus TaxID=2803851 RepID=UPI001EFAB7A1
MVKRVLDISGICLCIATLLIILINYPWLPSEIPSHYNVSGEADAWATKAFIFFLPTLGIIIWGVLHFITRGTKLDRYINVSTLYGPPSNEQISSAKFLIDVLKFETVALFSYLAIKDIYTAYGKPFNLGMWEAIIILGIFGVTILLSMIHNYDLDKKKKEE